MSKGKYRPELADELLEYFDEKSREGRFFVINEVENFVRDEDGKVVSSVKVSRRKRARRGFPTIQGFCAKVGIGVQTFYNWLWVHPEFREAYKVFVNKQFALFVDGAINGIYDAKMSVFIGRNIFNLDDIKGKDDLDEKKSLTAEELDRLIEEESKRFIGDKGVKDKDDDKKGEDVIEVDIVDELLSDEEEGGSGDSEGESSEQ